MKLTTRSEYALLSMIHLSRQEAGTLVSAGAIASAQNIPREYLGNILSSLKHARYVRGTRGPGGGYRLAKPPDKITIAEIVRLMDGALAPTESVSRYFYEPTPIEREKALIRLFRDIRDYISDKLERTTLKEIT